MIEHVTAPAPRLLLRMFALRRLLNALYEREPRPGRVCEVGAGLGDAASMVKALLEPARLDLYEESDAARAILTERFGTDGGVRVDGSFEGRGERYDLVLTFEVLEHIEDDARMLSGMIDSLSPGGHLVGSVPAFMSKWQAVDEYAGHVRRYEPEELVGKLRDAGFTDVRAAVYGAPLTGLLYLPRQLHYRSRRAGSTAAEMHAATLQSGTSRDLVNRFDARMVVPIVRAFAAMQHLPWLSSLGDGLLFSARRTD